MMNLNFGKGLMFTGNQGIISNANLDSSCIFPAQVFTNNSSSLTLFSGFSTSATSRIVQRANPFGAGFTNECLALEQDAGSVDGAYLKIFSTNELSQPGDVQIRMGNGFGRFLLSWTNGNLVTFWSTGWQNMTGMKGITGGMISNVVIDPSCTFPDKVYNGNTMTNNPWSWWMLDPQPVATGVNGTNVYPIGQYDYDVAITSRCGGATSGTGIYDIVKWQCSNSVDFAGTLIYTGLVSTLTGVDNTALAVNLPKGYFYGIRLTNSAGLGGWHIQFKGVTK
jgi:hypothetical protein